MAARKGGTTPARILDIDTGAELAAIAVGDRVEWFAWAPDGSSVAVIAMDGTTDVWATAPPRKRFSFPASPAPTYGSITFSDDGRRLAARAPGEIVLAEVATGAQRRLPIPGSDAKYLTFSPEGTLLAATMADRSVRFWDVASGQPRGQLRQHAKLPEFAVWSPDGTALVTTTGDTHHLWDVASTEPLASLDEAPSNNTVFARGRPKLFSATSDGLVSRWNLAREAWARQLPGHRGWTRAAYTADGARIVTVDEGDGTGHLRVWTTFDGRLVSDVPLAWNAECGIAISADGNRLAALGRDGAPMIVDTATGALVRRIDAGPDPLSDLALSPDGTLLAAASPKATVRTWRTADGAPTGVVIEAPKRAAFSSVAFSPDGRRLLTSIAGWDTQVWETTGAAAFTARDSLGLESAYSADGRRIITGGSGAKYPPLVVDAATGAELLALPSIQETTPAAAINRDGSLAAIMSYNGVITIASATTGAVLRVLDGPTEVRQGGGRMPSTTLAFSPDDRQLLATGHGFVLLWNIELDPRTPEQAAAVAAAKSPWRLVDGRLVRERAK
jgi:WD40 repeat protein